MSHQATVPVNAARYFGGAADHPIVAEEFRPGRGWVTAPSRHHVSGAWILKLRRAGVTHVVLSSGGRRADFTIAELVPWTGLRG